MKRLCLQTLLPVLAAATLLTLSACSEHVVDAPPQNEPAASESSSYAAMPSYARLLGWHEASFALSGYEEQVSMRLKPYNANQEGQSPVIDWSDPYNGPPVNDPYWIPEPPPEGEPEEPEEYYEIRRCITTTPTCNAMKKIDTVYGRFSTDYTDETLTVRHGEDCQNGESGTATAVYRLEVPMKGEDNVYISGQVGVCVFN